MKKTENLQLNLVEGSDPVDRTVLNENFQALDRALSETGQALDKTEQALTQELTALAANLGTGGSNARIAWGSYVGTGTYGEEHPTSLTMDFPPVLVLIGDAGSSSSPNWRTSWLLRPHRQSTSTAGTRIYMTWSDHGVSWYVDVSDSPANSGQNNSINIQYHWVALGAGK